MGIIEFLLEQAGDALKDKAIDAAKDKAIDAATDKAKDYAKKNGGKLAKSAAVSIAKDVAIDKAIHAADKRVDFGDKEKKSGFGSGVLRFFFTWIWLFVILIVDILSFIWFPPIVGALLELAFAAITFLIPYLRRKGTLTRYWGWLALLSAIVLFGRSFG